MSKKLPPIDGYTIYDPIDPLENLVGPFFWKELEDGTQHFVLKAEAQHCNRHEIVHGGLMMTMIDLAMVVAAKEHSEEQLAVPLSVPLQRLPWPSQSSSSLGLRGQFRVDYNVVPRPSTRSAGCRLPVLSRRRDRQGSPEGRWDRRSCNRRSVAASWTCLLSRSLRVILRLR